ncbi:MAG: extracellular solute-binding protein [bacterium]|nr:extracellular solute-binding protein [bacterium]
MKKCMVLLVAVACFVTLSGVVQVLAAEKVVVMYEEKNEYNDVELRKAIEYIASESGVEFVPEMVRSDWENNLNLALAGGAEIDMIQTKKTTRQSDLIQRGAIQPLNDALDKYGENIRKRIPEELWKVVTDENGTIWGIPQENVWKKAFEAIAIRKDWREQLGMGPITTIEELEEYLMKVKEADPAGNGQTIPLAVRKPIVDMIPRPFSWIFTEQPGLGHDGTNNYMDENGNITPLYLHPGFKEMWGTFAGWYANDLIYKENFSMDSKKFNDLVINNRVACAVGWYSDIIKAWEKLLPTVPEAEYEYLGLKTVNGNEYKLGGYVPARPQLAVVSYSKKVDAAVKLVDWMLEKPENILAFKMGRAGVDYELELKDDDLYYITDLKADVKRKDKLNFAMSIYVLDEIQGRHPEPDWRQQGYYDGWAFLGQFEYVTNPDWYISYDWTGTPVEVTLADGDTFMEEALAKLLTGKTPMDKWDDIIKQYRKMHADGYIEEATKQYNAKKQD